MRIVHSFVGESKVAKAYSVALQKALTFGAKAGMSKGLGLGVMYGSHYASWALLSWYGGVLVRNGTANGGHIWTAMLSILLGGMGLGQAMPNVEAFTKARGATFKILKSIDHRPIINNDDGSAEILESIKGSIELNNVTFSYPSRPNVSILKNFSLVIPPRSTMAIVGRSGSGKSTIISLIERFYEPLAGEILLDGHNLKKLNLKWLRGQIGLVNQEPTLFAMTIAANISYGKENATQTEIEEAAKASNAHTFINQLPLGYQTQVSIPVKYVRCTNLGPKRSYRQLIRSLDIDLGIRVFESPFGIANISIASRRHESEVYENVGERGLQLSAGQKQRIAIARVMIKSPTILLLDEATSALDVNSEQVVQETLNHLMVGRTTIIVAHRLSTIRHANNIAMVQQGQIVECGTHEELVSREGGAYFTLVQPQEIAIDGGTSRKARSSSKLLGEVQTSNDSMTPNISPISPIPKKEGKTATCTATKETTSVISRKGLMMRLIVLNKEDWIYGLGGLIGSILAGCLNPIWAIPVGSVLAVYYDEDKSYMKKEVAKHSLIFIGLAVSTPLIYTLQHYCLGILGEKLIKRVREQMFNTILSYELGWFDRFENNSNQILARLSSDAMNVRAAIGDRLSVIMQNMALIFVSLLIGSILQWKMALIMGALLPVLVVGFITQRWALTGFVGDLEKAHIRATRVAREAVENIQTVAAFNAEEKVQVLFLGELKGPIKKAFYRGQIAGFTLGICEGANYASYALALWYAGNLVVKGETNLTEVLKVFVVLIFLAQAMAETLTLTPDLIKGGQALESVFEILDRKTEIDSEDPEGMIVDKIKGDIKLEQILFAYPSRPDVMIFKDLNLKVSSSHSLALVGSSGSGKSSVIALIERFYDPHSGRVLVDGIDLKRFHLQSIRKHIALVMQEPALFASSIYENILYGKEGASEAEVIEAAKVANAHTFISSLPDGYKTQVGECGVQLSGGQKQRVAIARAVLKDPAILLLDEATSALDAESEKVVQEALDQLMKGRTTVLVAHRLSTIQGADSIAVMKNGSILEEGTHNDLIIKGGGYADLINKFPGAHS